MHITAFLGSHKKNGFTGQILNQILAGAQKNGHSTELIFVADLNLKECTTCRTCQGEDRSFCIIRDDIVKAEDAIKRADLIIWASPTHWGNISAYMLRMFERLFGFLIMEKEVFSAPLARNAKGKKAVLVTSCSTPSPFDWIFNQSRATFDRMREMCRYSGQKIVKTFVLPGTIKMKEIPETHLKKALLVGLSL